MMPFNVDLSVVLDPKRVLMLESNEKREVLSQMIECLGDAPEVKNPQELYDGIFRREELMSTGIGVGIGVPHVRLDSIKSPIMCVGICRNPIFDYESLDGEPVRLIFMIVAGKNQHDEYIKLLASISSKLKDMDFHSRLLNASDEQSFYHILVEGK